MAPSLPKRDNGVSVEASGIWGDGVRLNHLLIHNLWPLLPRHPPVKLSPTIAGGLSRRRGFHGKSRQGARGHEHCSGQ